MVDAESFMWNLKNGEVNDLKTMLSKSKTHVDDVSLTNGRPAIICAADYGQTEVVKLLIESGSNVNVLDEYGISALLAAIWEGHTSTVEVLLKNGANKNLKSPGGNSYSSEAESPKIKALLEKY